ncbi:MAG: hypothetical protein JNL21_38670 [Myxococcales bacterium]|nr:hypothetical protein [Myxococcales bacterium]
MVDPNGAMPTPFSRGAPNPVPEDAGRSITRHLVGPIFTGTKEERDYKVDAMIDTGKGIVGTVQKGLELLGNDRLSPNYDPSKPNLADVLVHQAAKAWVDAPDGVRGVRNVINVFNPFYQFPKEVKAVAEAKAAGRHEEVGAHLFGAGAALASAWSLAKGFAGAFASGIEGGAAAPAAAVAGGGTNVPKVAAAGGSAGGSLLDDLISLMAGKGSANPNTRAASSQGSRWHADKPGHLPDQLRAKYPNTQFSFKAPGKPGQDVQVVGGVHPSDYPGSTWPKGVDYGDFKPDTKGGRKTFKHDQKTKWTDPTVNLPYDPKSGGLR